MILTCLDGRLQAIQSFDEPCADELHYSSVGSISKKDLSKVRAILVKAIEEVRQVVSSSGEETAFCYNLDLFNLMRD